MSSLQRAGYQRQAKRDRDGAVANNGLRHAFLRIGQRRRDSTIAPPLKIQAILFNERNNDCSAQRSLLNKKGSSYLANCKEGPFDR